MKILIVDDEVILAKALMRAFSKNTHEVAMAQNGLDGLKLLEEFDPDVIMLDVIMPGMNGLKVMEEVKARSAKKGLRPPKIVLMTAHSGTEGEKLDSDGSIDALIRKPFENIFDLVKQIEDLVVRYG